MAKYMTTSGFSFCFTMSVTNQFGYHEMEMMIWSCQTLQCFDTFGWATANPGSPGKWPFKTERQRERNLRMTPIG